MRVRIQKWGNSLAVRIPKALALEVQVAENAEMEMVVERGKLVLSPAKVARYSLQALVSAISAKNRHHEIDFGEPVGKERV